MTKVDTNAIVSSLITEVAMPEILSIIRRHHAATGELPTDDQVKAQLQADADRVIATGSSWLAQHGVRYDGEGPIVAGVTGGD